jgi:hypothetical protein
LWPLGPQWRKAHGENDQTDYRAPSRRFPLRWRFVFSKNLYT